MTDMAGFPVAPPRNGPDMTGFLTQPTYRQQPDMAGTPEGARTIPLRRGPIWTQVTYGPGVNCARRLQTVNGVSIGHGGNANSTNIGRSVDGQNWETVNVGTSLDWVAAASDGKGTWIMVAGLRAATATYAISHDDGKTWALRTMPSAERYMVLEYGNGVWLAIAGPPATSNVAYTTSDGYVWQLATMDRAAGWVGAAFSPEAGCWIAISSDFVPLVSRSVDNVGWTPLANLPIPGGTERLTWHRTPTMARGLFYAPGTSGGGGAAVFSSPDGRAWTQSTPGFFVSTFWGDVASGQGILITNGASTIAVPVSQNGLDDWISVSTNGVANGTNPMPNLAGTWHIGYLGFGKWAALQENSSNAAVGVGL